MDIATTFNPQTLTFDFAMDGADLAGDDGLRTAVIISLFTDRKADPDDVLPDDDQALHTSGDLMRRDRRGWWGDFFPENVPVAAQPSAAADPVERIGSRLWLLSREKQMARVEQRAKEYAEEALQWLIDDGVASSVTVLAETTAPGILGLEVTIRRPNGPQEKHRFDNVWKAS